MASQQHIGVCYSGEGHNLPTKEEVAAICRSKNIKRMRINHPNPAETLQAFRGLDMEILLDLGNECLREFSFDKNKVRKWFQDNVQFFFPDVKIRYICVGNEVEPCNDLIDAMKNIHDEIVSADLLGKIKVTTAIDSSFLVDNVIRPSQHSFRANVKLHLQSIIEFLKEHQAPLLANFYPYKKFIQHKTTMNLSYALFTGQDVIIQDGEFQYRSLFDAMLDSFYSAVEKEGGQSLEIVVSKAGWPSNGGHDATKGNAKTYYKNLIDHVKQGTPKSPSRFIETYLFAMFDVNQTDGDGTYTYGLFYPNKEPKYSGVSFY